MRAVSSPFAIWRSRMDRRPKSLSSSASRMRAPSHVRFAVGRGRRRARGGRTDKVTFPTDPSGAGVARIPRTEWQTEAAAHAHDGGAEGRFARDVGHAAHVRLEATPRILSIVAHDLEHRAPV